MLTFSLDFSAYGRLGDRYVAAAAASPKIVRRAVGRAGEQARTKMRKALVGQTGLPPRTMTKAIKGKLFGSRYIIESKGGNVRLRFFSPRETKAGVTHKSPNRESPVAGAFIKGGRFPNRHGGPHGGKGVYSRVGPWRFPLKIVRSNVWIPREMIRGRSAEEFYAVARTVLPQRILHEIMRSLAQ